MAEAFINSAIKKGLKLNDIIEDFKYVYKNQKIKAGDFVNYINGVAGSTTIISTDTLLSNSSSWTGYYISAVQLDHSRILVIHSGDSTSHKLYGMVCLVTKDGITCGTDTQLSSTAQSGLNVSAHLLSDGKIFIAHASTSYKIAYGMICSINNLTISAESDIVIGNSNSAAEKALSVCKLSEDMFLVTHAYNSSYFYLYGVVVTIKNSTISLGTDTSLSSTKYTAHRISSQLLSTGKVFVAHTYSSSYYLYGIVVNINGTVLSYGTDSSIVNTNVNNSDVSTCYIADDKIMITYNNGSGNPLNGIMVQISDSSVSHGTAITLSSTSYAGVHHRLCKLSDSRILVIHAAESNYYLYNMVVTIGGLTITKGIDTKLSSVVYSGYGLSPIFLDDRTLFLAHSADSSGIYLYAQLWNITDTDETLSNIVTMQEYEQQVTLAIEPPFDAVALSSGIGGTDTEHNQQVKIARPNVEVI